MVQGRDRHGSPRGFQSALATLVLVGVCTVGGFALMGVSAAVVTAMVSAAAFGLLALDYAHTYPVVQSEIEIGQSGVTLTIDGAVEEISAHEFVHAESRRGYLFLTTRAATAHSVPSHDQSEAACAWIVTRLMERKNAWNTPVGRVPESIAALRSGGTE